ncbi:PilZ domain-containing protein [Sphingopyxis sp. EG6]|uniref:PilZ domain-containing protein n=1 Tax=Sphingopyxis sp. EG6 TaxID=1874061 RepID=UPI000E72C73C|nr:PilZ domain-containing protein [Sphingopyxis sp. EG6]
MAVFGHFLPAASGVEQRQDVRRKLSLLAKGVQHDGTGIEVQIHNISGTGLLFESDIKLAPCERIEIELPHAGDITAVVIWASGRLFGCQFEGPVSSATLSAVELKSAVELQSAIGPPIEPAPEIADTSDDPPADQLDDAAPGGFQEVVDRSREQIAHAAGVSPDRVRITIDY